MKDMLFNIGWALESKNAKSIDADNSDRSTKVRASFQQTFLCPKMFLYVSLLFRLVKLFLHFLCCTCKSFLFWLLFVCSDLLEGKTWRLIFRNLTFEKTMQFQNYFPETLRFWEKLCLFDLLKPLENCCFINLCFLWFCMSQSSELEKRTWNSCQ